MELRKWLQKTRQPIFEVTILILFSLWVGKAYLNFDPNTYIEGGEFTFTTISHMLWNLLPKCGPCIFWNGYVNGGSPSFIELHGALLHPLVILTTLLWGVINGSKVILLICFFMIGFGQWWLAKELKLGFWGRMWPSMMAIVGGQISGRLESGNVVIVLSIASASLLLPMFLRFKKEPNARNVVLFAILMALTWLSGQGYIQFMVIVAYFPVFLWYLIEKQKPKFSQWRRFF
jgi:hypothetical protein